MFKATFRKQAVKYFAGLLLIVSSLAVIGIWFLMMMQMLYRDKIYPRVFVGDIALGNKSRAEAKQILDQKIKDLNRGVEFSWQDKKTVISPSSVSFDGDLAYQLFAFDTEKTINDAYGLGRGNSAFGNFQQKLSCWLWSCNVPLAVNYNQTKIIDLLKQEFSSFEAYAEDASLQWQGEHWQIKSEKFGHRFDYQAASALFLNNLSQVKNSPIRLILEEEAPKIFQAEVGDLSPQIDKLTGLVPFVLKFEDKTWTAWAGDIRSWLDLRIDYQTKGKNISVDINEKRLGEYFDKKIAPAINQLPKEAKFDVADGRVSLFQASNDGRQIDIKTTAENIRQAMSLNTKEANIAVAMAKAESDGKNIDTMGIEEIIGTGTSNFAGSPVNRRHNIKVGASAINGLLIKPGEEFSLVKALGEIDASTGYLPELVIKQNRTIPEYGGGLCQIGTTAFRTAVESGLKITERRSHSYRVQYYEPAGTDATIYNPWPDFKFVNDTKNYILIQTRIEGDVLTFDFWGKRDGRIVEKTKPVIYNIVKPPLTRIVETLDLKPGVKKCTERAHNGASAYFDYKVTYADGTVKEERFSSHYVPWQEVCLLGVEALSDPNKPADGQLPPANPDALNVVAPTGTGQ